MKRLLNNLVPPSGGQRFPALDGLRAVAVFAVLTFHIIGFEYLSRGTRARDILSRSAGLGVCIFFALSAFLLYYPWAVGKTQSWSGYFRRRFFRIMPAYVVALIVAALVAFSRSNPIPPDGLLAHLFFVHTWKSVWWRQNELLATWSLAPEVYFYLSLPLLVLFAARRPLRLVGLIIAAALLQGIIPFREHPQIWRNLWNNWPVLALPFCCGMLAAWFAAAYKNLLPRLSWLVPVGLLGAVLSVLAPLLYTEPALSRGLLLALSNERGLIASLGCSLMIIGLLENRSLWVKLLASRPMRALGICGYGLFLFHLPVRYAMPRYFNHTITVVMIFVVTIIVAGLSYYFIEAPAMRFAHGKRGKTPAAENQTPPAPLA